MCTVCTVYIKQLRLTKACLVPFIEIIIRITKYSGVWSGSAKVRPTNLDNSRARAYCD